MQTMWDYATGLAGVVSPMPQDGMWMVQGHWQYSPEVWTKGGIHGSSIVLDEQRAGVNAGIAWWIGEGDWKWLNIIEVDNVSSQAICRCLGSMGPFSQVA